MHGNCCWRFLGEKLSQPKLSVNLVYHLQLFPQEAALQLRLQCAQDGAPGLIALQRLNKPRLAGAPS